LLKLYARGATIVLYVYALRGYTDPFQLKLPWGAEREKRWEGVGEGVVVVCPEG